ncbi:MAG: glycerol-3-phosphate 1-O-acyltransferase PlsY [Wolinella sp.]
MGILEFFTNLNIHFYILAYFIGGIPFGYVLSKYLFGVNLQESGSGSIGATNVLRVLKDIAPEKAKKIATLTMLLDALKGAIVILLAKIFSMSIETQWGIAVIAVIGHCFSPYLKFEGGKGVATGLGVMAIMLPIEALIGLFIWFITGKILKISSLSSLFGLLALIVASFIIHYDMPIINTHAPIIIISFIIFYKHIPNIVRLFQGQESKVI